MTYRTIVSRMLLWFSALDKVRKRTDRGFQSLFVVFRGYLRNSIILKERLNKRNVAAISENGNLQEAELHLE